MPSRSEGLEVTRHGLPRALEDLQDLGGDPGVIRREKHVRAASAAGAPTAADAVYIRLTTRRAIEVDHAAHVLDVEATLRHIRRNE